jgi:predicted nucleic acid-binding protein
MSIFATDGAAWDLLASHSDKSWSLVDCASFVVMRERSISAALIADHHFDQAGFSRLLK